MNKSGSVSIRIYLSLAEEEDEDEDALLCIKEIRLLPVCTKILPSTVVGKISVYFQCLVKQKQCMISTLCETWECLTQESSPRCSIKELTLNLTRIFSIADLLDIGN